MCTATGSVVTTVAKEQPTMSSQSNAASGFELGGMMLGWKILGWMMLIKYIIL